MKRTRDSKQYLVRLGMFAVLAGALCTRVPSALGQTPETLPASATANVWQAGGQEETTQADQIVPPTPLPATPWGTPVLVSPRNGTGLFHYPRTTTLIWQPVLTANLICSGGSIPVWQYLECVSTGHSHGQQQLFLHIRLTFSFVGAQPGKWRVTTLGGGVYRDSAAIGWRWFSFTQ